MSERPTPETDAEVIICHGIPDGFNPPERSYTSSKFARRLERERDEARAERDAWRNHAERFAAILSDETPLATIGTDVVEALEEFRSLKEECK